MPPGVPELLKSSTIRLALADEYLQIKMHNGRTGRLHDVAPYVTPLGIHDVNPEL